MLSIIWLLIKLLLILFFQRRGNRNTKGVLDPITPHERREHPGSERTEQAGRGPAAREAGKRGEAPGPQGARPRGAAQRGKTAPAEGRGDRAEGPGETRFQEARRPEAREA